MVLRLQGSASSDESSTFTHLLALHYLNNLILLKYKSEFLLTPEAITQRLMPMWRVLFLGSLPQ